MKTWYKYKVFIADIKANIIRFNILYNYEISKNIWWDIPILSCKIAGKESKISGVPKVQT